MQSIYLLKDDILNAGNSEQHLYITLFSNLYMYTLYQYNSGTKISAGTCLTVPKYIVAEAFCYEKSINTTCS